MKKTLFVLCFAFASFAFGQTSVQKKLVEDVYSFMLLYQKKDYDKMLEQTYPKVFEYISADLMKTVLKATIDGTDEMKIKIYPIRIEDIEISEIFTTAKGEEYAFATSPLNMDMIFVGEKYDEEQKKTILNLLEVKGISGKFINENTINIRKQSLTIAIKDEITKQIWKFVNHDQDNPLYVKILPVEIIKKAKEYQFEKLIKEKEKEQN